MTADEDAGPAHGRVVGVERDAMDFDLSDPALLLRDEVLDDPRQHDGIAGPPA